jgi:MoaA/NifB/PqqE/SkfB family radical SAM enzyme
MCNPENSHLIDKEYRKIGIVSSKPNVQKKHVTGFEIIEFENLKKLYIAGGEPTVMTEMYDFLDRCIATKNTQHEILVNTNGTKLSDKFKKQLKHFTNLQFIFSIDGFEDINRYIRWPSNWKHIIENWKYLRDHGHKITVNTAASIYNIDSLSVLFEFIDKNFPGTLIHVQSADSYLSPFHHPDRSSVIEDLEKIQKLSCYSNDLLFSKTIDGFLDLFRKIQKQESLQKFFEFNDQLDHSRGVKLADYIPSLEKFRS